MQVVELEVASEESELAADALWQAGASAVTEEPLDQGRVRLRADVTAAGDVDRRWVVSVVEPDVDADLDAWRAFARPVHAGGVRLQPPWLPEAPAGGDEVVLRLDPGRAFGSGSHPSTTLALEALATRLRPGATVLDVGCGSGVLGIASGLLGARSVTAIDVDPEAVRATEDNARRNHTDVAVSLTAAADIAGTFDLVVANIGAAVLIQLAPVLRDRTAPGGHLVLSGLLLEQSDEVAAAYRGCAGEGRFVESGWVALVLRRWHASPIQPTSTSTATSPRSTEV